MAMPSVAWTAGLWALTPTLPHPISPIRIATPNAFRLARERIAKGRRFFRRRRCRGGRDPHFRCWPRRRIHVCQGDKELAPPAGVMAEAWSAEIPGALVVR